MVLCGRGVPYKKDTVEDVPSVDILHLQKITKYSDPLI